MKKAYVGLGEQVSLTQLCAQQPMQPQPCELLFTQNGLDAQNKPSPTAYSNSNRRYIIKPSEGKDFVETALGVAADAKNQTGFLYGKLFKVRTPAAFVLAA